MFLTNFFSSYKDLIDNEHQLSIESNLDKGSKKGN